MTAIDTSFDTGHSTPPLSPTFLQTFQHMASLSWPIMLGAMIMALLHTGQAGLLGHIADRQPLFLLSMLQPWYLLFFAFLEAVAITGQVFSAKSATRWPKGGVKIAVVVLSLLGALLLGGLLGGLHLGETLLTTGYGLIDPAVMAVLPKYLLTLAPFIVFEILNGALRGQGRSFPGFAVLAIAVAINLGLGWYLLTAKGMGIEALFLANLVSGGAATVLLAVVFLVQMRGAGRAPLVPSIIRIATLLGVVGLPVFFSMLVSFVSSSVMFEKMGSFGADQATSFLLAVRMRFFLLIPATALATALAVLVNQAESEAPAVRTARLGQGVTVMVLLYIGLVSGLYVAHRPLIDLLVAAPEIQQSASAMVRFLLPSYVLVAFVVFSHVILENLGRGIRVFVWTVILESGTVFALLKYGQDTNLLLTILAGSAVVYALIFAAEYALLVRAQGQTPAPRADAGMQAT